MSKAAYWQKGDKLDYKNTGTNKIEAGTIVSLNTRVGVAGTDIEPNETGSVVVEGVFVMPKATDAAIALGDAVYMDNTGNMTKTATGNTPVGYAVAAATESATSVVVKLLG